VELEGRVGRRGWRRDPALAWVVLAVLYVIAAVLNVLLMISMAVLWPLGLAAVFAVVAGACLVSATRERRRREPADRRLVRR
jgi:fatty acid desaturase